MADDKRLIWGDTAMLGLKVGGGANELVTKMGTLFP
jgi:hypothetical protein